MRGYGTVKAADDRLLLVALFHDNLDMGVFTGQVLYLCKEVGARILGRGPSVAVLEDEFADLGEESGVAVGGA